jgi:hypothetical protein
MIWIDIKDQRPKPGFYVYALFDFGNKFDIKRVPYYVDGFDIKRVPYYVNGFDEFNEFLSADNITHWMEYPEIIPPTVIENKIIDNLKRIETRDRKLKELGI